MSYYPHKKWDGWWTIDYSPEGKKGKRIREHIKGTEEDAINYERQLRQLHVSKYKTAVNPQFRDIADAFEEWAKINRAENYQKSIMWALKNLRPHFGLFPPSRITDPLIEAYKLKRKDTPRACNQELEMLQIIINWGANAKRGYCRSLPFKIEKLPYKKALMRVPAHENFEKFIEEIDDPRKKALCLIMYWSGPRFNDIVKARWEDIDWVNGHVISRVKRGAEKVILVPEDALKLLEDYKEGKYHKPTKRYPDEFVKPTEGYIFVNRSTGLPWTSIKKSFKSAWENAGIQKIKGPHTLRHACGKNTLDTTGDLRLTQEMLGHTQIRTTQIYTQVAVDRLKAAQSKTRQRLSLSDK